MQNNNKITNSEYETLISKSFKNTSNKERSITTGKVISSRGTGEIDTKVSATGLQIEEEGVPFSNSELGGALRKAIDEATKQLK